MLNPKIIIVVALLISIALLYSIFVGLPSQISTVEAKNYQQNSIWSLSFRNLCSYVSELQSRHIPTIIQATTTRSWVTPSPTPAPRVTLILSPVPKPTATPTTNSEPITSPVPTLTPSPVPTLTPLTPTSPSSKLNALVVEHLDIDFLNLGASTQQTILNNMVAGNIKIIFVQVGQWKQTSGTVNINYFYSPSQFSTFINTIHSKGIAVYAWIMAAYDQSNKVDISTSTIRTQAVNVAVNCVNTYGFDGVMDDLYEGCIGSDSNYVSFANALGTALHNIDKKASCALFGQYSTNYPLLYGGITTMDYIQPMFYSNVAADPDAVADVLFNYMLPATSCPILAGFFESSTYSLSTQLNAIGHPTNSKFVGVSPYSLVSMKTNDWSALSQWSK